MYVDELNCMNVTGVGVGVGVPVGVEVGVGVRWVYTWSCNVSFDQY